MVTFQVHRCDACYTPCCARLYPHLQVFRQSVLSAAVCHPIPLCLMSLSVGDLDAAQLHLFHAGVPDFELWAEDPGLWALPMTRELYAAFASRIMYIGRAARVPLYLRDDPAEHR